MWPLTCGGGGLWRRRLVAAGEGDIIHEYKTAAVPLSFSHPRGMEILVVNRGTTVLSLPVRGVYILSFVSICFSAFIQIF